MKGSFSVFAFETLVAFSVLQFYCLVSGCGFVDLTWVCYALWDKGLFLTILGKLQLLPFSFKTLKNVRTAYSET